MPWPPSTGCASACVRPPTPAPPVSAPPQATPPDERCPAGSPGRSQGSGTSWWSAHPAPSGPSIPRPERSPGWPIPTRRSRPPGWRGELGAVRFGAARPSTVAPRPPSSARCPLATPEPTPAVQYAGHCAALRVPLPGVHHDLRGEQADECGRGTCGVPGRARRHGQAALHDRAVRGRRGPRAVSRPRRGLLRRGLLRLIPAHRPGSAVIAESLAGLAAQPARRDQVLQQRRRREPRLAELLVETALDGQ